jgi:NAD(P)-dependent dehydrogenase (short-subunit alcohol dehydrogenase family)
MKVTENDRIVLVTGASGGIGRATVEVFNKYGWKVIGVDRQPFGDGFPGNGLFIQSDVSIGDNMQSIFDEVQTYTDHLDALVNNAAIQVSKPIVETTIEDWDAVMASNLRSLFLGTKLAYPLLKKGGGGAVVNVSSVHAVATSKNISAYAASKGGQLAFTRAIAIELAPDNIRANAILPGAVDTPMLREGLSRGQHSGGDTLTRLENLAQKTVIGRVGTPQEIGEAIYFLADNERSSFMTGQALIIDGGATTRLSTE